MRSFISVAAIILGLVLAAFAVPAIWVDRSIVQEEGFVALTGPLGNDPAFQEQLATDTVGSLHTEQKVPAAVIGLVAPVLETAAKSLVGLPGYPAAWEETLRSSHRLSFSDPETLPAESGASDSLTLDVAPLLGLVTQQISDGVGVPLTAPDQSLINVGESSHRQIIQRVSEYAPVGYILAVGSVAAFILALFAARRRWTVLAGVGIGFIVIAGIWALGLSAATGALEATDTGVAVAELFKREFVSGATDGFGPWIITSLVGGGVLLLLGVGLRAIGNRARM